MDVLSYLCWSRTECSRELSKYELSFCDHFTHPYSFYLLLVHANSSLTHLQFFLHSFIMIFCVFVFSIPFLFCLFYFLTSFPTHLFCLHTTLDCLLLSYVHYSLVISLLSAQFPSCINRLTPLSSLTFHPFHSVLFHPPLPPPNLPTCPRPGQSRTSLPSPSAHLFPVCLLVFSHLPVLPTLSLSLSLPPVGGLVELDFFELYCLLV